MNYTNPTGILLINLGTPQAPDVPDVRKYLSAFLKDKRVIDLPSPWRQLLVNGLILPFRPKFSAHAYRQIWSEDGSPLLVYSQRLAKALGDELGEDYAVALGMRYGKPSIRAALDELNRKNCKTIKILPLFPQYSSAATGSAIEKTVVELIKYHHIPSVSWSNSFYNHDGFINAWKEVYSEQVLPAKPEMWIFSYHGLPVRQLKKGGDCYQKQCYATSQLLAQAFQLTQEQYRVGFQSRLGRTPWITPYTDQLLHELASQGIKHIGMVCPSFVADCLETLEEIGIRAKQQWLQLGGSQFTLLPCLNDHPAWVRGLKKILFEGKFSYT